MNWFQGLKIAIPNSCYITLHDHNNHCSFQDYLKNVRDRETCSAFWFLLQDALEEEKKEKKEKRKKRDSCGVKVPFCCRFSFLGSNTRSVVWTRSVPGLACQTSSPIIGSIQLALVLLGAPFPLVYRREILCVRMSSDQVRYVWSVAAEYREPAFMEKSDFIFFNLHHTFSLSHQIYF